MSCQIVLKKLVTMYDLFLQQKFTDFYFKCQNGTIGAHFPIIAGHCKLIKQNKRTYVLMLNYPKDLIRDVLELMYKGEKQFKTLDVPSVMEIFTYLDCSYQINNSGGASGEMRQIKLNHRGTYEHSIIPALPKHVKIHSNRRSTSQVQNSKVRILSFSKETGETIDIPAPENFLESEDDSSFQDSEDEDSNESICRRLNSTSFTSK